MAIVSVSLPDALLDEADEFIEARGFAGRSDIMRSALRDFLARERGGIDAGPRRTATLTLLYPEGYERKIGEIRHEYSDIVKSMMHGHIPPLAASADEMCVEVFMLEGAGRRLQEFADALRGAKETRLVQLVPTSVRPAARREPSA